MCRKKGDYRVVVYAICKNEEAFARRWMDSMREADEVVVLDTGSTDKSVEILRECGARVEIETIEPWRFDAARNRSLALVDDDAEICVCTDLDEVLHAGWREAVERAWTRGANRLRYRYTWSFNADGGEDVVFFTDKIHGRHGFCWVNPVHEVLKCEGEERIRTADGVQLDHLADPKKSRAQYLPLLELAVREDPENDRNVHYLAREYYFRNDDERAIAMFQRHLSMKSAAWRDERCASMRYLAAIFARRGDEKARETWLLRAIAEAPHLREPWLDAARAAYGKREWDAVAALCNRALLIRERPATYITQAECYGALPHDLLSLAYYHTGRWKEAAAQAKLALEYSPNDARIAGNLSLFEKAEKVKTQRGEANDKGENNG